jgi:mono/diheme cytochrome c family protein
MNARIWFGVLVAAALAGSAGCRHRGENAKAPDPVMAAYDTEADWADAQRVIPLGYQQAQGKRIFYEQCVWCHADATPAGPSNRSNLTPVPPLLNDGATLNAESEEHLQQIITQGGAAIGKSAMMPPYGRTLSAEDIRAVISFARAIAQPAYQPGVTAGPSPAAK